MCVCPSMHPRRFHAVLVDNGLLRKNEAVDVVKRLKVKTNK